MHRFLHKIIRLAGLGATLGLVAMIASCSKAPSTDISDQDMTQGNPNAKVTLVEYASVTCAHCAHFNETVMPDLEKKYIQTGKINYVYREFLTAPQDVSAAGILMARCAGKDKYFKVVDAIMRSQPEMFQTQDYKGVLLRIATSVGMTPDQFNTCVTDPKGLKRIQDNIDHYVKTYDITGTPTFFINGKKFDYKGGDISEFDSAFKPLL